jgi:hypothetical protein
VSLQRLLWGLVAVVVVAAGGVGMGRAEVADEGPSAASLAAFLGCPPTEAKHRTGLKETVVCTADGFDVTAVTFDDNAQRDAWVNGQKVAVVLGFDGAALVAGDRWAVKTGDAVKADRLYALAGGWRV